MAKRDILVVGSVALDSIKTPLESCRDVLGGSATYFSLSASFFSKVNMVAVVGSDFPRRYLNLFKKRNIDIRGLEIKKGKTFRWKAEYGWDFTDPRTIYTHFNVFSDFEPRVLPEYRDSRFIFLANIDPQLQERVLSQINRPELAVSDTMNYWIENKRRYLLRVLKKIDIFLLNDSEARQLTGELNIIKAGKTLLEFGPRNVIIKRGEYGSLMFSNDFLFSAPAFLLESVFDPTGAGDTFAGGFMGYLAGCCRINRENLRKAVIYGNIMATFAVEDFSIGGLISINNSDIKRRLKEYRRLIAF